MKATTETNWIHEIGEPAYASIADLVACLTADRERLQELRDDRDDYDDPHDHVGNDADTTAEAWELDFIDEAEELEDLESAVTLDGDELDEEQAGQRIQEDPLSVRIFGERIEGEWVADKFELLLTTGGPAVRIMGELSEYNEPTRAWLEVQDWGQPWSTYFQADPDVLLRYAECFCYE